MRNHFRKNRFDSIKAIRFFALLFLYFFVTRLSSFSYNMDLFPGVHVRELLYQIPESFYISFIFNIGFAVLAIGIANEVISQFCNLNYELNLLDLNFLNKKIDYNIMGFLDFTNPFLYSSKTRGLLE